jgi:hypothetical protein
MTRSARLDDSVAKNNGLASKDRLSGVQGLLGLQGLFWPVPVRGPINS